MSIRPFDFPVDVGELRDDVALNRLVPAHRLDLVLEAVELAPLRLSRQRRVVAEDAIEARARGTGRTGRPDA